MVLYSVHQQIKIALKIMVRYFNFQGSSQSSISGTSLFTNYSKRIFLVEIKFITEDSEKTHKQILILN